MEELTAVVKENRVEARCSCRGSQGVLEGFYDLYSFMFLILTKVFLFKNVFILEVELQRERERTTQR